MFVISNPAFSYHGNVLSDRQPIAMSDLPDDILNRIDADHDETVKEPLATILYDGERAWYTKKQLNYRLREDHNVDVSKPAMTERLDELQEIELVAIRKVGGTNIYYWDDDASEWPIPSDVVIQSEFSALMQTLNTSYAIWGVAGIIGILVGGLLTILGTVTSSEYLTLPISPGSIIAVAFLTLFCSYVLVTLYLVAALVDITVDPELPSFME